MSELSPAQRTAGTARIIVTAGVVFAIEALWRGSVARTVMAGLVLVLGGGLLFLSKRSD